MGGWKVGGREEGGVEEVCRDGRSRKGVGG